MKHVQSAETRRTLHTHTHTGSLCLAFVLSILTFPTFSETLGNSPQCDNATLHTTTGPATLNARWTANTIILNWQPGNDATFTAPAQNDAAYSCEYDGGITLPTAPTRSGYTFGGWRVGAAAAQCVLSQQYVAAMDNEEPDWDPQYVKWEPISQNGYTMNDEWMGATSGLNAGEWSVTFTEGTIKGRALCSSTSGTYATTGTPNETGGGQYCWCAGTDFGNSCHVSSPSWVFRDDYGNAGNCAYHCARDCARRVYNDSAFRRAVFGVVGD